MSSKKVHPATAEKSSLSATLPANSERWLPALLLLFIASGAAALIYEIVWFQLLQLSVGSSAVSLGVLLGTFMGGMCLGSLLLPRLISAQRHPLRVYASLELGIGAIGLLVLWLMPLVGRLYTAWGGYGVGGFLLRGLAAAVCLLPPTLLMGATLPAIARWIETTPRGVSWLGFFYGGNIAGAVCGCLLAGFYLLRIYDVATATFVAVALNLAVALIAFALARVTPVRSADWGLRIEEDSSAPPHSEQSALRTSHSAIVYVVIALSGLCALAAEVIWTRLLGLLFGASVYTFSLILAVFLTGLGLGSSVGSVLARNLARPCVALGWCQLLITGGIAWAAYLLTEAFPNWPVNPSLAPDIWYNFQFDFARAFLALLPAAALWGASFPLALAALAAQGREPGRLVGGLYAANTVGAIVGALSASLLLVAWIGSQRAQQVLIALSALAGLLLLLAPQVLRPPDKVRSRWADAGFVVALGLAGLLVGRVAAVPGLLIAYGRYAVTYTGQQEIIYAGEGLNSSVAVSLTWNGALNYHNAGKVQASSEPQDMRLQRMLGHLTTLAPEQARSVLVIGCGAGVTAGAVSIDPRVERVTIAEIEPLVPQVVSRYFSQYNEDVVANPKVRVHLDDARHYLLTTAEKFDAITSDPLDPWVKGAANLYTKEFWQVAKQHLNPGGAVTVFVQLYESTPAAVKSELATFFEVFPHGIVWGNTQADKKGYDLVLLGQVEPTRINLDQWQQRLSSPEYAQVARSLRQIGFGSAVELCATYAGRAPDLGAWLQGAAINYDHNLRLQYLAGMGLNFYQSGVIYADLLKHARFPDGLFEGSEASMRALEGAIRVYRGAGP
jgi:spermidine synthase